MEEKVIYEGNPSQITNVGYYIWCVILAPIVIGIIMFLVRFLKTKFTKTTITETQIIEQTGVLSRTHDEMELYRVKDIRLDEPFFLRMFGLSNLILITTDKTSPTIFLGGIKDGKNLMKKIRFQVEFLRDKKGIKEYDI